MIWVLIGRKQMGFLRNDCFCACSHLLLLLLMLSLLKTSSSRNGFQRFGSSFRSTTTTTTTTIGYGSADRGNHHQLVVTAPVGSGSGNVNRGNGEDGNGVFGDEKRKVNTGPNPLHNR